MTLLAKKKAVIAKSPIKTIRLLIALCNEIPVDFIAANSYFSEKLPNTINDVTKIVNGRTRGINLGDTYQRNFNTIQTSKSRPANSEIYSQIVWSTKMNIKIMKTLKNVFR